MCYAKDNGSGPVLLGKALGSLVVTKGRLGHSRGRRTKSVSKISVHYMNSPY
jgi:hypothetical protein